MKEAQELLLNLGYKVGIADGIMGTKTRQAIKNFQRKYGMPEDGKISNNLITLLNKVNE
ncbi:MAG: peptidoglycan-binding protein [Bacteroidales bacterium]|nr:peptidoglycan-binding protein [Bacteroidales bacterium]